MKLQEILTQLRKPIPPELISIRKQGNTQIKYVCWADLADLLDSRCGLGAWSFDIREIRETSPLTQCTKIDSDGKPFQKTIGAQLLIVGVLTIYGDDRTNSYTSTGIEELDCSSFGDPASNASAMALRRCCALSGLGRQLWQK